ncbi:MAG: 50S ribosomal protein L17 [Chloroflexi bacterium]|nr:50S ribosomal protein L17 [Chloroflexota bacterium]
MHQRKFGRETDQRLGMLRNLTVSVLRYEKVKTTEAKAKEIRGAVDKMIGLGKQGTLAARRRALAWIPEPEIVEKLFDDLAQRYPDRNSGYLRTTRLGNRVGDNAPVMLLELMPSADEEKKKVDAAAAKTAAPRRRLPFRRGASTEKPAEKKAEGAAPRSRKKVLASKSKGA